MKSNDAFARLTAAIILAVAVAACATSGTLDRTGGTAVAGSVNGAEGTAVRQAVNSAIVGCATNPANDDARSRQPHANPFCSRKG